jgi:hypothetical protein
MVVSFDHALHRPCDVPGWIGTRSVRWRCRGRETGHDPLCPALDDYLAIRSPARVQARGRRAQLERFVAFVDQSGESRVTTELVLAWAKQPTGVNPHRFTQRLGIVRRFARYLATLDPDTDIPPIDLLPACQQRTAPYIYSPGGSRR